MRTARSRRAVGLALAATGLSLGLMVPAQALPAEPTVTVTVTATPDPVPADGLLTYEVHVQNDSPEPATGVQVVSDLGDYVSYVDGSADCDGVYDENADTVTFPIGSMPDLSFLDCSFQVRNDTAPEDHRVLEDDFESGYTGWGASHGAGDRDWFATTDNPHSPTHAVAAATPGRT